MPAKIFFLQEFTKELVLNSVPEIKEKVEKLEKTHRAEQEKKEMIRRIRKKLKESEVEKPIQEISEDVKELKREDLIDKGKTKTVDISKKLGAGRIEELPFDLGRINRILEDYQVESIECPGPGKFLIVKKQKQVIPTKMTLNKDEIEKIIQTFSEKSRIPLVGGVFKASVEGFIITALQSELIGSRFIITKIGPEQLQEFYV